MTDVGLLREKANATVTELNAQSHPASRLTGTLPNAAMGDTIGKMDISSLDKNTNFSFIQRGAKPSSMLSKKPTNYKLKNISELS